MTWIFLSPHFDDAAYSCGGAIWELSRRGEDVQVWTICTGEPPGPLTPFAESLHLRWGTSAGMVIDVRRGEDRQACRILGAGFRHFGIPDCIYRRLPDGSPLVNREEDLWQSLPPAEEPLSVGLEARLRAVVPIPSVLVSPLGWGGHVDHRLARRVAEGAAGDLPGVDLCYYADFPYVLRGDGDRPGPEPGWQVEKISLSRRAVRAWEDAIAAYTSQQSTFWGSRKEMENELEGYAQSSGGQLFRLGKTSGWGVI